MRKIISIVSAIGLLLAIGAAQAQASCYTIPQVVPINGYSIGGEFCLGQNSLSFVGVGTKSGVNYGIVAFGSVTGSGANLTLTGSVTVTQGFKIIKQVNIHESVGNEIAAIEAFIKKFVGQLP